MSKPIVITGYPYAYPYYFKGFEYVQNKDDLIFILPKHWEAKGGKIKIDLKKRDDFKIFGLSVWSYGARSLLGGLFKGWMPSICVILPYFRLRYSSRVLYSCLEPNLLTTLYNGFWAKLFGYKHVLFTWQNIAPEKRMSGLKLKLSNALVKLNLVLSDGIICGNTRAAEIIKHFEISRCRNIEMLVCPLSGVDTERFEPVGNVGIVGDVGNDGNDGDDRNDGDVRNVRDGQVQQIQQVKRSDAKFILFYGALEKRKGINILIDAFQLLTTRYSLLARLVVVGTGPEKDSYGLRITDYGLKNKTIFLDWMSNDELPSLLNSVDVFVYPSVPLGGWEEQFGYAMAEASACGVPVVSTKTGSVDEVVIDGKSGILVESNNSEQLADAINKILSDKEQAEQMGRFGREHVVKNYSHPVIANKLILFLKQF